jgi:hypothetical protein
MSKQLVQRLNDEMNERALLTNFSPLCDLLGRLIEIEVAPQTIGKALGVDLC